MSPLSRSEALVVLFAGVLILLSIWLVGEALLRASGL